MTRFNGTKRVLAGSVLAVALAFGQSAAAQDREVRVFNWSDYIDEEILTDFTKETGIKIIYDVFDSNEVLETKLLAGGTGYDIVVPSGTFLSRQISAGVFQKLNKSKLPNLKHMWSAVSERTAVYDPDNAYSINWMWGTTGIGYNEGKLKERMADAPVDSWDLIFNPEIIAKFKDCGIHVLDAPAELLPAAMNYLGLNPDSKDAGDIEKAGALLEKIRPNIQKFHSSEYINALANGDICLAVGWSGDVLQARDRADEAKNGQTIAYSIPKQGALMWFDQMAIPADAKNVEEAHELLNYLMRPEVIAKASNYVNYANGNLASLEFIDEGVKTDPAIYPSEEATKGLYVTTPPDPKVQRIVTRTWTKIVTGQ